MKYMCWQVFNIICLLGIGYLIVLLTKALRRYLQSSTPKNEKAIIKKSLGEVIKEYRVGCNMTQEFVAEYLGVSRQAVSKWESGISEPSTTNLLGLSNLFGISAEELLNKVRDK